VTSDASIQRLVARFAEAARNHYDATLQGDWRKANKNAKRIADIFHSLVATGEEGKQALLELTNGKDLAVASMAATFSLKYATTQATAVLERIAIQPDLLGFKAQQSLKRWQEGSWQLE
jgi:hypothetical protein